MIRRSDDDVGPTAEEKDWIRSRLEVAISEERQSGAIRALPRFRKRSLFSSGLMVALAAVALIIPAALFWGRSNTEPPGRVPVAAEPPVTPNSPATTAVQAVEWATTKLPNFVDATTVHEGRFYATSAEQVLVSNDAESWITAGHLPARSRIDQLISHEGLLVANGSQTAEDADGGREALFTVWVSADDGATWSSALVGGRVRRVTPTPTGLVATGWIDMEPVGDRLPRQATIWTSANGYDWTVAWQADADVPYSSVADAAIWNEGLVVIGKQGSANFSEGSGKPGSEWEPVAWTGASALEISASGSTNVLGNFEDLRSTNLGHFALTYGFDPSVKDSSAVWRSDDGTNWTAVDVGAGWYHRSITTDGSAIVIGGDTLGYAPVPKARIWVSTDGLNWHDFDTSNLPEGLRLSSVELHDGVLVVALYSNDEVGGYLYSTPFEP